jgi:hypothetical protein
VPNPLEWANPTSFNGFKAMKTTTLLVGLLACAMAGSASAQDRVFDWTQDTTESVQLDPSDYQAGRVYHAGREGGNMHVGIEAKKPVTVAMVWSDAWTAAQLHPETISRLEWLCLHEHVVSEIYECHLPSDRPMILVIRDERRSDRPMGFNPFYNIMYHGPRRFVSPSELAITYFRWDCVQYCVQPEYRWFQVVKEKYDLTSTPKVYSLLTPERDGQPLSLKIKAPVPMTIAVLPSQVADQVYDHPDTLSEALSKTNCKQRGIQSMSFDCTISLADGPQSLVVMPASSFSGHKKAEVELQAVKCVEHCELLNPPTQ